MLGPPIVERRVRCWHEADVPFASTDARCWGNSGHVLEMPPRRDFRVLRGTRVLAQCGCSGLLGVLDHRQHVSRVGVSSRLHGTYGYLACLGELGITKCDAALFITKLPKAEHDAEEWQAAMQALLLVAEHDGPTMFARIGVRQAINRHVERVFDPSRKDKHWGRRKLARDR